MKQAAKHNYVQALRSIDDEGISAIFQNFSMRIYQLVVLKNKWEKALAKTIFVEALTAIRIASLKEDFELNCDFEDYLYHVCRLILLQQKEEKTFRDFKVHCIGKHRAKELAKETLKEYAIFLQLQTDTTISKQQQ